ncbi:NAD-dependent succinate-semialdehyde dehydrogenase [Robertkochia marina]|uniref:NAD-dependent succinate-semialdehyde dehydrogenase n=1 Tax=Robertkochia marina TaxID=1227945 RepID=A0A4S3M342_9FLAO|nr:NAD-dependent succinate-semialdehyde dehydrogenase [Robertkochia marina]THD67915.1 NAD-dependent succinate-semialdehyde dehydrogenase [Robertkochia marina]TRZ41022.1 NAD-dependent succinate-semialdehyde dehydrogenase [Robertkochia marina]
MIKSINPYTGKLIAQYEAYDETTVMHMIEKGSNSFLAWRKTGVHERCELIKGVGDHLLKKKDAYARLMSLEMGKPVKQAIAEIEKCAWLCDYYSDNAPGFLKDKEVITDAAMSYVAYEPLGVVLAVMPWNYPFWQVFRFAVPTLLAGNTCLLKHASNVMGCAEEIQKIFIDCGFPEGTFQNLVIGSDKVEMVLEHPKVRAVSLTGSEAAGKAVAAIAGKNIKSSLLELGGSNATIILKDADLKEALNTVINARYQNTGQSCIAAKRLLVDKHIADEFIDRFLEEVKKLRSGDPLDEETYIGVLAREELAEELEDQMNRSITAGATILCGGDRKRAYFEPTVLKTNDPTVAVMQEETFGPLMCVCVFDGIEEAIELSNQTNFGLGVSIFTQDIERIKSYIPRFEEGAVFVNELVKSDPRLPFGGVKNSGYGRELGLEGIRSFVNVKTVYIKG